MYSLKRNEKEDIMLEVCDDQFENWFSHRDTNKGLFKSPLLDKFTLYSNEPDEMIDVIPTGLEYLDKSLGGGFKSGVYIFGANPGIGKTSLMLHLMNNLALKNTHSVFLNLEMSPNQIMTKLLANYSYKQNLSNSSLPTYSINNLTSKSFLKSNEDTKRLINDYRGVYKYINVISKSEDIDINSNSSNCNAVECIETIFKNYKRIINSTPVVIIDFLQLLSLRSKDNELDKRLEMNKIMELLKKYSNVYKAPIILISSLSRNAYTKELDDTESASYNLSAFKESGMIEYQADFLAILTNGQKKIDLSGEDDKTINISVLKSRFSPYTNETFSLVFKSDYSYFEENK